MNRRDYDAPALQRGMDQARAGLELAILATPTGAARNHLTAANIALMQAENQMRTDFTSGRVNQEEPKVEPE